MYVDTAATSAALRPPPQGGILLPDVGQYVGNETGRPEGLADGVVQFAGQAVALKPGAAHLKLIGPQAPLMEGVTLPITRRFEKAPAVTVNAVPGGR